jgi:hypothetical protein
VANFASRVADQMSQTGMPFDPKDPDAGKNRDIAKALVAKYEKASQEIDPAEFKAKKDIKGKAKETEAFESWVDSITNEYARDDYQSWLAKKGLDVRNLKANQHVELAKQFKADRQKQIADLHAKKKPGEPIKYTPSTDTEPARFESDPSPESERADAAQGMWASSKEIQSKFKTWQDFMNSEEFDDYLDDDFRNQLEGLTFEDIKPYVSMYKDEQDGKTVYDVLDKDGASAYKTKDSKLAMHYLSKNFNKLKMDKDERIDQGIAQQKADAETNPNWGKDIGPVDTKESLKESRTKIVEAIKAKVDSDNAQNIAGVEEEITRITQLANYQ